MHLRSIVLERVFERLPIDWHFTQRARRDFRDRVLGIAARHGFPSFELVSADPAAGPAPPDQPFAKRRGALGLKRPTALSELSYPLDSHTEGMRGRKAFLFFEPFRQGRLFSGVFSGVGRSRVGARALDRRFPASEVGPPLGLTHAWLESRRHRDHAGDVVESASPGPRPFSPASPRHDRSIRSRRGARRSGPRCRPGTASAGRSPPRRRRPAAAPRVAARLSAWLRAGRPLETQCPRASRARGGSPSSPRVSPVIVPRASWSQYGAPRPARAGTNTTPSLEATRPGELLDVLCRCG